MKESVPQYHKNTAVAFSVTKGSISRARSTSFQIQNSFCVFVFFLKQKNKWSLRVIYITSSCWLRIELDSFSLLPVWGLENSKSTSNRHRSGRKKKKHNLSNMLIFHLNSFQLLKEMLFCVVYSDSEFNSIFLYFCVFFFFLVPQGL